MTKTAEEIAYLYGERVLARGPAVAAAREITEAYEGRMVVPLTELAEKEQTAAANLIIQGIDHYGQLIGGVQPNLLCPPTKPGVQSSEDKATRRRRAELGWWEANGVDAGMDTRRGRQFVGHASAPVLLRPDARRRIPMWEIRDPLSSFPGETTNPDDVAPPDCVFAYRRSWRYLSRLYPEEMGRLVRPKDCSESTLFECLEYVDDEQLCLVVVSPSPRGEGDTSWVMGGPWSGGELVGSLRAVMVRDLPNRAGLCTAVVPGRVGMTDLRRGQFDNSLGMYRIRAALWALWIIAVRRNVFAEGWVAYSDPNQPGTIVTQANPEKGVLGEIHGGSVQFTRPPVDVGSLQAIDRLMEQERIESAVPADMTGLSASNVRTARRGAEILSATVDDQVAEAQKMMARSKQHELRVGVAIAKAYFGAEKRSFYVSWKGAAGNVDYTPNTDFDSDVSIVEYPMAGSSIESLTVMGGQMMGLKVLSREDFQEIHPLVRDVERTKRRLIAEALEDAGAAAINAQAAQGQLTPPDWARISMLVRQGADLDEAVERVHREAQERQSTTVEPAQAGSPEAQPGLAQPGMGAEAGVAGGGGSPGGLGELLQSLGRPPAQVQVG